MLATVQFCVFQTKQLGSKHNTESSAVITQEKWERYPEGLSVRTRLARLRLDGHAYLSTYHCHQSKKLLTEHEKFKRLPAISLRDCTEVPSASCAGDFRVLLLKQA